MNTARPRCFRRAWLLLAALAALAAGCPGGGVRRLRGEAVAPDVRGQYKLNLPALAMAAGFNLEVVVRRTARQGENGIALEQSPAPGETAPLWSKLRVTVGRFDPAAAAGVPVPTLTGRSLAEARAVLESEGLTVGECAWSPAARRGLDQVVTAQDPPAGTAIDPARPVRLTVLRWTQPGATPPATPPATAPALVAVPDLAGKRHPEETLPLLEAAGLAAGDVTQEAAAAPEDAGRVCGQEPAAGQEVPRGSLVQLAVAQAAPAGQVEVPHVVRLPLAEAQAILARRGLRGEVAAEAPTPLAGLDGRVKEQDPPAGGRLAAGAAVRLVVYRRQPEGAG